MGYYKGTTNTLIKPLRLLTPPSLKLSNASSYLLTGIR